MPPFFCRVLMFTRPIHFKEGFWASQRVPIDSSLHFSYLTELCVEISRENICHKQVWLQSRAVQLGWPHIQGAGGKRWGSYPTFILCLFLKLRGSPSPPPTELASQRTLSYLLFFSTPSSFPTPPPPPGIQLSQGLSHTLERQGSGGCWEKHALGGQEAWVPGLASAHSSISPVPTMRSTQYSPHFSDGEIGVQSCEAIPQVTRELMAEFQSVALLAVLRLPRLQLGEGRGGAVGQGRENWELKFPERGEGPVPVESPCPQTQLWGRPTLPLSPEAHAQGTCQSVPWSYQKQFLKLICYFSTNKLSWENSKLLYFLKLRIAFGFYILIEFEWRMGYHCLFSAILFLVEIPPLIWGTVREAGFCVHLWLGLYVFLGMLIALC